MNNNQEITIGWPTWGTVNTVMKTLHASLILEASWWTWPREVSAVRTIVTRQIAINAWILPVRTSEKVSSNFELDSGFPRVLQFPLPLTID